MLAQLMGSVRALQLLAFFTLGAIGFLMGYLFLFSEQRLTQYPALFMGYVPATATFIICLFLYLKLRLQDRGMQLDDVKHFLGMVLSFLCYVWFLTVDADTKTRWILDLYSGDHFFYFLPFTGFSGALLWGYGSLILKLDPAFHSFNYKKRPGITGMIVMLGMLLGLCLILTTVYVPLSIQTTKVFLGLFSVAFTLLVAFHIRHPDHLVSWIKDVKKTYEKRHYLDEINVEQTASLMFFLMEKEKLYQDHELTLPKLAERLSVSRYQLSQLLNQELNISFYRFLQNYRVKAAQALLLSEPKRTILSIALEVGFNSNSAFQNAFKHLVGQTPSDFRTHHVKNTHQS